MGEYLLSILREGFVIKGSVESRFYMNCLFIPVAETENGEMVENFLFSLFKDLGSSPVAKPHILTIPCTSVHTMFFCILL